MAQSFQSLAQWLMWQETLHPVGIDLGLERIQQVAAQMKLKRFTCPVIVVGGTNGKGSCCAILEAIFLAAGLRVGLHTSPHLLVYNERIHLQGKQIADTVLCQAFAYIDHHRQDISLTYFEFGVLAALYIFQQQPLDVIILEVGLGGRLDAVNIVDADVAVITGVDLDHEAWLGRDRESIAREKAGIFRTQKPVVCGDSLPPASLLQRARDMDAPIYCQGKDFHYTEKEQVWTFSSSLGTLENLPIPTLVLQNAATALMAIQCITALKIPFSAIQQGLQKVSLMGRFQSLARDPHIIVDVAHNPQAARMLAELLTRQGEMKTHAIVGMMADKDILGTLAPLMPLVSQWYVCDLPLARAASAEVLKQNLWALKATMISCYANVADAYTAALTKITQDQRLIIFGSFWTVSAMLNLNSAH